MTYKSIVVDLKGFLALERESVEQRGGTYTPLHEKVAERNFKYLYSIGKKHLIDGDLGGGIGDKNPATWTSWSVEQMAEILTARGIEYEWDYDARMFIKLW